MPIISKFFGIIIFMFWRDHNPPHFHAKYSDYEIIVNIETGEIIGNIPRRALDIIQEWRILHKQELLENWSLSEENKSLNNIKPYDLD